MTGAEEVVIPAPVFTRVNSGGNPESVGLIEKLDSRFHGNDRKVDHWTFYENIMMDNPSRKETDHNHYR
jgi:hypothetical protein